MHYLDIKWNHLDTHMTADLYIFGGCLLYTSLPGGYDMELNEDASNVSQGQKQLLTIARAILADNPILILDEATSCLLYTSRCV